ncbi:aspartyl/asparaginyl beta-hydroxylase isoform X2 [Drosophila eugracilis]|uniref:aspartyl/asparaginyl beta-hydroxylase isoform X2 n=1 Tax=Drosophila eugracilis TaxID=29029 RepID=UPI0007E5EAE5|nr:aspartyl/asparaginyl beta-hydroxylase isoform X2 [Drosophila eugracilis]
MSGDVQPRKRKDKRRKRDDRKSEGDVTVLRQSSFQDDDESSHGVHITKMGNEDLHLHVHHEHGTGGHWCAKIIFFALMAVLLGLVGLIIMENRGLEDLDTPLSESRFSKVFDGWVDEHRDEHDAHDVHEHSEEALDDPDEHDEHDDHDDHEEEEEPLSEELEEELEEEEEPTQEEEPEADDDDEEDEDEENNAGENITAEDADEEEDEDNEEEGTVEATVEATTEATAEATAEYEAEDEEDEEAAADEDDDVVESTEAPPSEADEDDDDEDEKEQEVEDSVEPQKTKSVAQSTPASDEKDDDDDEKQEQDNKDADDEDEDDFESLDQQFNNDDVEPTKDVDSQEQDHDQDDEEVPKEEGSSWLASLAVKFGVGVALALVSRLVLIRKSPNTTEDEPAQETIMRRRLTIATAEDHIPDDVEELPLLDDEYSEEEIEIEEEIEVEMSDIEENEEEVRHDSNDNVASMASYIPETFEQLSSMYKFAQEPAKETKSNENRNDKDTGQPAGSSDITYVEYEDGAIEDYEHDEDSDEDITDEEDEISDVDDADLMNRLEAKYGRLPVKEFESDPDSDDPSWTQIKPKEAAPASPTEKEDPFEQELRKANQEMIRENYAQALRSFNTLTTNFADEPLAHLGKARVLELISKKELSNQRLWEAIDAYKRYLAFGELVINDKEFTTAGESCIENLRFLGSHRQATMIHELLIERLPKDPRLRNQLSLTYLMVNNLQQVEKVAVETLKLWPDNAVAQLHYGLALRQLHGDYNKALPYLKYAVESQEEGTQEAFFYLSLGETLQRLSKNSESLEVYRKGVAKGFFDSLYQRSLYNEPRLKAQPFWQPKEIGYERQLAKLKLNWRAIRDEGLALLGRSGFFEDEAEQLRDKGVWQQYELYTQGRRVKDNCQRAPITCSLLQEFPESSGCRRGQVKFSVMQAGTHVWPHCGPTNCRLRAHLTLLAPEPEKTSIRVAEQERTWREGELFIFDDSFEHEVWHNGSQPRLVLILDMWHPQLTITQRRSLVPI